MELKEANAKKEEERRKEVEAKKEEERKKVKANKLEEERKKVEATKLEEEKKAKKEEKRKKLQLQEDNSNPPRGDIPESPEEAYKAMLEEVLRVSVVSAQEEMKGLPAAEQWARIDERAAEMRMERVDVLDDGHCLYDVLARGLKELFSLSTMNGYVLRCLIADKLKRNAEWEWILPEEDRKTQGFTWELHCEHVANLAFLPWESDKIEWGSSITFYVFGVLYPAVQVITMMVREDGTVTAFPVCNAEISQVIFCM